MADERETLVVEPQTQKSYFVKHTGGCHCGRVRFEVMAPAMLLVLECKWVPYAWFNSTYYHSPNLAHAERDNYLTGLSSTTHCFGYNINIKILILIYVFNALFSGHPGWGGGGSTLGNDPGEQLWGTPQQILHYGFHKSLRTRFLNGRKYPLPWGNNWFKWVKRHLRYNNALYNNLEEKV